MNKISLLTVTAMIAAAAPLAAQGRGKGNGGVPPGQRPPAGMCRIWIDGVPPGQQPAPTDCATANANRPPNARVIYGDRARDDGRIYNPNGRIYYPNGSYPGGSYPGGSYPSGSYPNGSYPNGGVYYPSSSDPNRRVVVINGRRCVQSTDNNGRVHTYCSDSDEQRSLRNNRRGNDRDNDRDDDHDEHDEDRGYRNAGRNGNIILPNARLKGGEKHKAKGKGHND
jgi:hypothetical protein